MPFINQLNTATSIQGADLVPIFSQLNGDSRKISLSNFALWVASQVSFVDDKITQYSAPATGATVQVNDATNSVWLVLTPSAGLAALTLKMPLSTTAADKQEVLVNCTQAITTLTLDANGATIVGGPTTLAANGYFTLRFDGVMKTWYRVG